MHPSLRWMTYQCRTYLGTRVVFPVDSGSSCFMLASSETVLVAWLMTQPSMQYGVGILVRKGVWDTKAFNYANKYGKIGNLWPYYRGGLKSRAASGVIAKRCAGAFDDAVALILAAPVDVVRTNGLSRPASLNRGGERFAGTLFQARSRMSSTAFDASSRRAPMMDSR